MQKAELVLTMLNRTSKSDRTFKFQRLYRNLFNPDFYLYAYSKIYSKEGNMTAGTDGQTIDGFNKNLIKDMIGELKYERYNPTSVRRIYIPKKNGKLRPLGIPSFREKLLQEIIREILEAIYEPVFSDSSHGFRPNRSCHTILHGIKQSCIGSSWVIEGDIKSFFDNIDHDILLEILRRKIDDERFIGLIKKFLKAGYIADGIKYDTTTGSPQGALCSPVLANIYLTELDEYMKTVIQKYNKGEERKANPEYKKLKDKCYYRRKKGNMTENNQLYKLVRNMPSKDQFDPDFVRIKYFRYADDFVVFMIGSLELAKQIRDEINQFIKDKLKLELNIDKTLITNLLNDKVRFLGYDIYKTINNSQITRDSINRKRRNINGIIQLSVPIQVINKKIMEFTRDGKPFHRKDRVNWPVMRILDQYNSEFRGLYNYYQLAYNVGNLLHKFKYYHYFSLVNTVCIKENKSQRKIMSKYGISVPRRIGTGTRKIFGIKYQTKDGNEKEYTYFNKSIKRIKIPITDKTNIYEVNKKSYCELIVRLNKGECELCSKKIGKEVMVHHIRKLKELIEQYRNKQMPDWLETMKKLRRKTLIVCHECHGKIHKM